MEYEPLEPSGDGELDGTDGSLGRDGVGDLDTPESVCGRCTPELELVVERLELLEPLELDEPEEPDEL